MSEQLRLAIKEAFRNLASNYLDLIKKNNIDEPYDDADEYLDTVVDCLESPLDEANEMELLRLMGVAK